jgi:DHA2 family multidrug resistance protein
MPYLIRKVDPRRLVGLGLLMFAASCFINVDMTPDTGMDQLIFPQLLRAAGQPLATIPLTQLSVVGLSRRDTADSAGITSVMRNLGASIGIAMLSTMVQMREQIHFSVIAEAMTQNSLKVQDRLHVLGGFFASKGAALDVATQRALAELAQQVRLNASVMAYADSFWILGVGIMVSMLALLILRKPQPGMAVAVDAH